MEQLATREDVNPSYHRHSSAYQVNAFNVVSEDISGFSTGQSVPDYLNFETSDYAAPEEDCRSMLGFHENRGIL